MEVSFLLVQVYALNYDFTLHISAIDFRTLEKYLFVIIRSCLKLKFMNYQVTV